MAKEPSVMSAMVASRQNLNGGNPLLIQEGITPDSKLREMTVRSNCGWWTINRGSSFPEEPMFDRLSDKA
jgi:hypothetical protein